MPLTTAQLATLKTDIQADSTANALYTAGNLSGLAALYNTEASPAFYVGNTQASLQAICDAITWANLTPNDAVPSSASTIEVQTVWANRALLCQAKQFNLQLILATASGDGTKVLNGAKTLIRNGLSDALQNIPAGVAGAPLSAGWVAVRAVLARKATRIEKLFATGGTGANDQNTAVMQVEGPISYTEYIGL